MSNGDYHKNRKEVLNKRRGGFCWKKFAIGPNPKNLTCKKIGRRGIRALGLCDKEVFSGSVRVLSNSGKLKIVVCFLPCQLYHYYLFEIGEVFGWLIDKWSAFYASMQCLRLDSAREMADKGQNPIRDKIIAQNNATSFDTGGNMAERILATE